MTLLDGPEKRAADRNNLSLDKYREEVRKFAAYVAAILLPQQVNEETSHVLPTLKDPKEEGSSEI